MPETQEFSTKTSYRTTPRGIDLERGGAVLSEILKQPGPTHSVFDVLAVTLAVLAPGPRNALLGFAGGSLIGPLRAMGCDDTIRAVDLEMSGYEIYKHVCGEWGGKVQVTQVDAVAWLKRQRRPFDLIMDDLSILGPEGETKPELSVAPLPQLIADHLAPHGIAVFNMLKIPGLSMAEIYRQVAAPWDRAVVIHVPDHENKIIVAGNQLPSTREIRALILEPLKRIGCAFVFKLKLTGLKS